MKGSERIGATEEVDGAITAWRLKHPRQRLARCLVCARAGGWQMVVWNHTAIAVWERCRTREDAFARAHEIHATLAARGWIPVGSVDRDGGQAGLQSAAGGTRTRKAAPRRRLALGLTAGTVALWLWRRRPHPRKFLARAQRALEEQRARMARRPSAPHLERVLSGM